MKILFLSDTHKESASLIKWFYHSKSFDKFVVCGDFEIYGNYPKPVYFLSGNHEDWQVIKEMDTGNLQFQNCEHIKNGQIVDIDGIKIVGLNGVYSKKNYLLPRTDVDNKGLRFSSYYTKDDIDKLCSIHERMDILISHDTVEDLDLERHGKSVGRPEIKSVIDHLQPRFFFSGHHHIHKIYNSLPCKMISLDYATNMGYCIEVKAGNIINDYAVWYDEKEYQGYLKNAYHNLQSIPTI